MFTAIFDWSITKNEDQNMGAPDSRNILSAWEEQKAILKAKFRKLTDADLDFEEDRKNEMVGKLALKLGMTTREIRRIITPTPDS